METENKQSLLTSTAIYGSLLGIIIVIYSLLLYIFNVMPTGIMLPMALGVLTIAIYVIGIIIFAKKIRNASYPETFPFGTAFLTCFLIALFASIVSTIYTYIQNNIIDPEYMTRVMNAQKEYMTNWLSGKGISEDQLQSSLDKLDESAKDATTLVGILKSFFWGLVINAIASLIIAAAIKRKPNASNV